MFKVLFQADARLLSSFLTTTTFSDTTNLSTAEGECNTFATASTSTTATTTTTAAAATSATTTSTTFLVAATTVNKQFTTTATEAIGVVDEVLLNDTILISTIQSELYTCYYQKISTQPSLLRETIDSGSLTIRRNNMVSKVERDMLLKLMLKDTYMTYMNDMQFMSVIHSIIHS